MDIQQWWKDTDMEKQKCWEKKLMLYKEIMAVCSEIHTKHINTVCGQNVELLNVFFPNATTCPARTLWSPPLLWL
jgi:hypothetical protein